MIELVLTLLILTILSACQFSMATGRIPNAGGRLTFSSEQEQPGWSDSKWENRRARIRNVDNNDK